MGEFFRGKNRSFGSTKNTSFSAVGGIYTRDGNVRVIIYENVFARHPLDFESLPKGIEFRRILLEEE